MDRTKDEVALRALRMIGVVASDEPPTADQSKGALDVLEGLYSELRSEVAPLWDVVTGVPPEAFIPLANYLAAELAGEYGVSAPMTRPRAKIRLMAVIREYKPCPTTAHDPCADYGMGAKVIYLGQLPGPDWNDEGTW